MQVTPRVFDTPADLGLGASELIVARMTEAAAEGRRFLLGCPSGRSPSSTYAALARLVAERQLDLSSVVIVMMDDYLVHSADGTLVHEDEHAPHSCIRFGREQIVDVLSLAAGPGREIADEHLWFPGPADSAAYDDLIRDAGGIDVFLLASGASDGHLAFNPPGSAQYSRTRVVELPQATRTDNLATFPTFGRDLSRVPTHGVTVGIATILELSREVVMLVHGADKGLATARLTAADAYDETWPATVFVECRNPALYLDVAAVDAAGVTVPEQAARSPSYP